MRQSKFRKIYFGIFWTILIGTFIFFAALLILIANGYYFDFKNFHLQRTGMIILNGNPKQINLEINGKLTPDNFPLKTTRLFPGRYAIKISKENYYSWEKVFKVEGGQAIVKSDLNLFLKNPVIKEKGKDANLIQTVQRDFKNQGKNITILQNEVWLNDILITRFSQQVLGVISDGSGHYYVQLPNEIRAIDTDGSNDVLLFKIEASQSIPFAFTSQKIQYVLNETVFEAQIH